MSVFRKCKLPQLIRGGSPSTKITEEIPCFKCSELPVKQRIGHGLEMCIQPHTKVSEIWCVIPLSSKECCKLDQEERNPFHKEISFHNDLHHPNIVRLKGVSVQPLAMMLKYMYFDFKHFGHDGLCVHSLADFLPQVDEFTCEGLFELLNHAAKEIIHGLAHLHSKRIAHRDLKPANILRSNQHYCTLSDENEIVQQFECRPVACKVTVLGKVAPWLYKRSVLVASQTNNIDWGTVVYEAPELFVSLQDQSKIFISSILSQKDLSWRKICCWMGNHLERIRGCIQRMCKLWQTQSAILRRGKQESKTRNSSATVRPPICSATEGQCH